MTTPSTARATLQPPYDPIPVDDLDIAFPSSCNHLMPAMDDIPDEFKNQRTIWNKVFARWFFSGLDASILVAKDGIDRRLALRHLKAFIGSFEPRHEHKDATAAYLMSLWFQPLDDKTAATFL